MPFCHFATFNLQPSTAAFWLVVLGLALGLRLVGSEARGIWQDEGLTLYQIRLPFAEIVANRIPVAHFMTQNTVPPLFFVLLGAWGRLVGFDLWVLRLFSILCTLLVSLLLYRVGAWLAGPQVGRIAALLAAISPLYLWYAQELRMYAFLLLPATLSFGLLWRWHEAWAAGQGGQRYAVAYALTAGVMAWTHYLAFLLLAAQGLWLLLFLLRRRPRVLLTVAGGLLLVALPLLPFGLRRLFAGAERDFFFQPLDFIVNNLLHSFALGVPVFMSRYESVAWLFPVAWTLLALGLWQAWRRGGWPLLALLGGGLALPVLALYALSYLKPLYQNARHLLVISPAFFLLWALGLSALAQVRRWLPLVPILLLSYGWGLAVYTYHNPAMPLKNDVRPLFEQLARQHEPGEIVVLNDPVLQHAFEYFAPDVPWTVLPPYTEPDPAVRQRAYEEVAAQYDRLWYVYGPPDSTFDTWEEVYDWFDERFARLDYREFPGQTIVAATLFDTQGPTIQNQPFPAALPADARFGEAIRFVGLFKPLPAAVAAGQRTVLETLWTAEAPPPDYQVVLHLSDGSGQTWHQEQLLPFSGLHPTSRWLPGQFVRLPLFFEPPADLPPADYQLTLSLVAADGRPLFPDGDSSPLPLGPLTLTRPDQPLAVTGPTFGGVLRVQPLALPERLPPAATLPLALRVQVVGEGALPDTFEVSVQDAGGATVWSQPLPLADGLPRGPTPPPALQPGDAVTLRYTLSLPPTLEGTYSLHLAARQGERALTVPRWLGLGQAPTLALGTLTVEPRTRRTEIPPIAHEVAGQWGEQVRLLGYSATPEPARTGETLTVQLVWQGLAPTERPYKVFLHLFDEQGTFITGADAFLDAPSMAWGDGEIALSEHRFDPLQAPPGRYTLLVGLYHEASGERLPVDAPNSALPIGDLDVE